MKKQICILTKSLKDHEYCVAGIEINSGKWIRLVTTKEGGSFPKELLDENKINVLDVIEVDLLEHVPYYIQTENWLIDISKQIRKIGHKSIMEIKNLHKIETPEYIFGNCLSSLSKENIKEINHSLEMVKVDRLEFDVYDKCDGRPHFRVNFIYNGHKYTLSLTDPKYRDENFDKIIIPSAIIIVSLPAVPYGENENYNKFVAKIVI